MGDTHEQKISLQKERRWDTDFIARNQEEKRSRSSLALDVRLITALQVLQVRSQKLLARTAADSAIAAAAVELSRTQKTGASYAASPADAAGEPGGPLY